MKICTLGSIALFEERGKTPVFRLLSIALPEGSELLLNGAHRYLAEGGYAHIPIAAFKEGENRLSLCLGNTVYQTEGLTLEKSTVRPVPLAEETLLFTLLSLQKKQEERLGALENALRKVEADQNKRKLFN